MADNYTFFTPQKLDYGNQYLESGYANLGAGIASGLSSIAQNNQAEKSYKMKAQLENQMKIDGEERLRAESLMDQWSTSFPNQPPPMSADGKPNLTAMMGALGNFERVGKPLQVKGASLGVERSTVAVPGSPPAVDDSLSGNPDAASPLNRPQTDTEYAQSIRAKEQADKLKASKDALLQRGQEGVVNEGTGLGMKPQETDFSPDGTVTDEYAKRVADEKQSRAQAAARNGNLSTARQLVASEHPDLQADTPEYNAALNHALNYTIAPAPMKMAMKNADGMVDSGLIPKGDKKTYDKEVLRFASFGGNTPPAPPALAKTLGDWNTLQSNQQDLLKQIDDFNVKHPEGFDSYVGPLDNATQKVNMKYNSDASEGAKDASRIMQGYQNLLNQRMHDMSGTAVTASEMQRNMLASGDPGSVNFVNSLRGWHDATAGQYANQLRAASSYAIPESLTTVRGKSPDSYIGYWKQGQAGAAPTAGGNDLATSLQSAAAAELARRNKGK